MKIVFKDICEECHPSTKKGNSTHGYYVYHNIDVVKEIVINDTIILICVFQTGNSFDYNDYDYPSNKFDVFEEGTSEVLCLINERGEDDDTTSEDALEFLEQIKELEPFLETFEKINELYLALRDEVPSCDLSEDCDDYEIDEETWEAVLKEDTQ